VNVEGIVEMMQAVPNLYCGTRPANRTI